MKKEMVGSVPGTVLGMLADFCHKLQHGVLTEEQFAKFLKKENPFAEKDILMRWTNFYRKFFGIETDFSDLKLPEGKPGFDRLIVITKGLTLSQVYKVCAKHFLCWCNIDNLDKAIPNNDRTPNNGAYSIWVRNRVEADEELKNLSADQLKEQNVSAITLLERMVYELKYFDETGQHLDVHNCTLCAGSRYSGGYVPYAYWNCCMFEIGWRYSHGYFDTLRARAVVS